MTARSLADRDRPGGETRGVLEERRNRKGVIDDRHVLLQLHADLAVDSRADIRELTLAAVTPVAALVEQLDVATRGPLEQQLAKVASDGVASLIVDLRRVTFIDSGAIQALFKAGTSLDECCSNAVDYS